MRYLLVAGALAPLCGSMAAAATVSPFLLADQTTDSVVLLRDLNGDGDTNDPGEATTYFDASNGSGLATPTGNVFSLTQASSGAVFLGDGNTDTVYRTLDLNADGSANGAGEATVWFSATDNASGFTLNTPNGIAEGPDGALYVVEADTVGNPSGDYVYRTIDLNGDGDANDEGEITRWLDLKAINASSSPFQISFDGDTAYIADTAGATPDVIYAVRDADGDGIIGAAEVSNFATESANSPNLFDFSVAAGLGSVWTWEWLAGEDSIGSVMRLTDLDGSGAIDALGEAREVWNTSLLGDSFEFLAGFSMALSNVTGELLITSNAGSDIGDWVIRLFDLDGNGSFWGEGEWSAVLARSENGEYPQRARAVAFYDQPAAVPLPASLPLLGGALAGLAMLRRRRNHTA
ncbi:VPLPA-CTERM sorting domain-containing protein [Tropicimonas sp.]|uniref:VPLPA-CTERM sorting domain-containing protein n=1 Tax=Tropicimonas sp. TaxID=2067044 RepID=UPI003A87692F